MNKWDMRSFTVTFVVITLGPLRVFCRSLGFTPPWAAPRGVRVPINKSIVHPRNYDECAEIGYPIDDCEAEFGQLTETNTCVSPVSHKAHFSPQALSEVETALQDYIRVVEASGMALTSRKTYIIHADQFARWLKREFQPGVHAGDRRPKRG